jgi:hypothetical protein
MRFSSRSLACFFLGNAGSLGPALAVVACVALFGCSSAVGGAVPIACGAPDDPCLDAGAPADASARSDATADAADAALAPDAHCSYVDDSGVTHACGSGGQGPGDRDDGGGIETGAPDVAVDASNLPFGSPCWDNAQCTSGICYDYKVKGQFCTQSCTTNADCPAPSLGCNGMGFCRMGQ